jgi:hypothetical protein
VQVRQFLMATPLIGVGCVLRHLAAMLLTLMVIDLGS